MKEYQRPEFYVEEFVANEYVAVCTVEGIMSGGTECGTYKFTGELVSETGNISNIGIEGMPGSTGDMYRIIDGAYKDGWAYKGSIMDENHEIDNYSYYNGKWNNGSAQQSYPIEKCNCVFAGLNDSSNNHHHVIINITETKNHS